jgi:hypothetical protein
MAAAADRHLGDLFERVSPELVLVDAALAEEMRRRLDVPDDTLVRIARMRLSLHVAEVRVGEETEEENPLAGCVPLPVPATGFEVAQRDVGIDDLIVVPESDPPTVPSAFLAAPDEGVTRRLVAAPQETVAPRDSGRMKRLERKSSATAA